MALRIDNPIAEKLARDIARQTGETITQAITVSLEERLMRLNGHRTASDLAQELVRIGKRAAALPDLDLRSTDEILGYGVEGVAR